MDLNSPSLHYCNYAKEESVYKFPPCLECTQNVHLVFVRVSCENGRVIPEQQTFSRKFVKFRKKENFYHFNASFCIIVQTFGLTGYVGSTFIANKFDRLILMLFRLIVILKR